MFKGKLAGLDAGLRESAAFAPPPVLADRDTRKRGRSWVPAIALGSMVAMTAVALYLWSGSGIGGKAVGQTHGADTWAIASDPEPTPLPIPDESVSGTLFSSSRLRGISLFQSVSPLERELEALQLDGRRGLDRLLALGSVVK